MAKSIKYLFVLLSVLSLSACSLFQETTIQYTDEIKVEAKIEGIDYWARTVTLRTQDGELVKLNAGYEVKNFKELEVGDTIESRMYQSVIITIEKDGVPSLGTDQKIERTEAGEKPGIDASQTYEIRAKVLAIDFNSNQVQLQTPMGTVETIRARNPENLKLIEVGDIVKANITRGIAIEAKKIK